MSNELELAAAVATVREEILRATKSAENQEIVFEVGDISMEFAVEIRKDAEAKFGFTAWVIAAGAGGGVGRSDVHKVTVSLTPRLAGGGSVDVAEQGEVDTSRFGLRSDE